MTTTTTKTTTLPKLAAVAALVLASLVSSATPAVAGKGGGNARLVAAVQSGSVDAIIGEVEKSEQLMCSECVVTVAALLQDDRFAVREVAAWWIAKRPSLMNAMVHQYMIDMTGDSFQVRNAADFLGRIRDYQAIPAMQAAIVRTDLSVEARLAVVGAVGYMAHVDGDATLQLAMADPSPQVRAAAVTAYRFVLDQTDVSPVVPRLGDGDASVRAAAAAVVGAFTWKSAVNPLVKLVTSDPEPTVRRNAAWALGRIGDRAAQPALIAASADPSGLVSGVAKAALASLDGVAGRSLK